jgi:hypothetical protein
MGSYLFMANAFENVIKDQSDMEPWGSLTHFLELPFSPIVCFYNVISAGTHLHLEIEFSVYWSLLIDRI